MTDQQSIVLKREEPLIVTLKKIPLYYLCHGGSNLGMDYDIQSSLVVQDYGTLNQYYCLSWLPGATPLEYQDSPIRYFKNFNQYHYQAGGTSGSADLNFISFTYPRYYSHLRVHVE
jgi:hypothetical protein